MKKKINSRSKGKRGERALAKVFSEWWGTEFTSTPLSGGFGTKKFRDDWNASGDLVTPDDSFPFCVECKNAEGWHLEQLFTSPECLLVKWWRQSVNETPFGKIPLLVFKRNRHPWMFFMALDDMDFGLVAHFDANALVVDGEHLAIGLLSTLTKTPKEWWART